MEAMIKKLKKLAMDNYEDGGDTMVECWETEDYIDFIQREEEAGEDVEKAFYKLMGILEDRRKDIESTIF